MYHRDLDVYKMAIELAIDIYKATESFPKSEMYSLCDQMKRASVSVSSNIAEGAARQTVKEFIQFLYISSGSLAELESQLLIAHKLGYINDFDTLNDKIETVKKMIHGLIRHQKQKL
jgi:four helix bundle protein